MKKQNFMFDKQSLRGKPSEHLYIMGTIILIRKVEIMTKNNLNKFLKCMVRWKTDVMRCLTPLKQIAVRADII